MLVIFVICLAFACAEQQEKKKRFNLGGFPDVFLKSCIQWEPYYAAFFSIEVTSSALSTKCVYVVKGFK